jgi:hypothetical protein
LLVQPIALGEVRDGRIHVRQESTEWWIRGKVLLRDYATGWIDSLDAMAWVEVNRRENQGWIRGWMD